MTIYPPLCFYYLSLLDYGVMNKKNKTTDKSDKTAITILINENSKLNKEIDELDEVIDELETDLEIKESGLDRVIGISELTINEKSVEIDHLQGEKTILKDENERLNVELNETRNNVDTVLGIVENSVKENDDPIESLSNKIKSQNKKIEELEKKNRKYTKLIKSLKTTLSPC
jgi:chromosome segregation ATPase